MNQSNIQGEYRIRQSFEEQGNGGNQDSERRNLNYQVPSPQTENFRDDGGIDGLDNVEDEEDEEEEGDEDEEEEEDDDEDDEEVDDSRNVSEEYQKAVKNLVDIGNLALWSVSTHKADCGVTQLRDGTTSTYWQSDGVQPHHVNIHFSKKVSIKMVSIFVNFYLDESYTPSQITILAGDGSHSLKEVKNVEFHEPIGWKNIKFDNVRKDGLLKASFLKVVIVANHQNGKDTHIRDLKIFSPDLEQQQESERKSDKLVTIGFNSLKFISESRIR